MLVDARDDVLEVGDADDVVEVLADHRDPGEAAAQRQRQRLPQRLAPLDEDHVGARHHDLPHDGVAELEHRVDHRPLARLDHLPLLQQVDQPAQIFLGAGRPRRAAPGRGVRAAPAASSSRGSGPSSRTTGCSTAAAALATLTG